MGTQTSAGYKSSYTGDQIDAAIKKITDLTLPEAGDKNYVSQTYAQLKTLKTGSKLVAGTFYLISDYSTNYKLLVLAVSTNEFSRIAYPVGNTDCKYVEYEFTDETKYGIINTAKGKVTKYVDKNGNEVPFDFKNLSSTVANLNQSSNCVLKPMADTGYTAITNAVVFNTCKNVMIHAGCYKITCNNCENITIMPGVHDIIVDATMNGSVISYNPTTDTINVIRD